MPNTKKIAESFDNIANERNLENKLRQRGNTETEIDSLQKSIDDLNKLINGLAAQCERNALLRREIEYATAVYEWFRESYDRQEIEVKQDLLESVNKIFKKMYHGSRQITIDDSYHIQLITNVGDEKITTDESKGLDLAFRYDADDARVKKGMELFNSYARGGIQWLYDEITQNAITSDDYYENISNLVKNFSQDYEEAFPKEED